MPYSVDPNVTNVEKENALLCALSGEGKDAEVVEVVKRLLRDLDVDRYPTYTKTKGSTMFRTSQGPRM